MDPFVRKFQPHLYQSWLQGQDLGFHPEEPPGGRPTAVGKFRDEEWEENAQGRKKRLRQQVQCGDDDEIDEQEVVYYADVYEKAGVSVEESEEEGEDEEKKEEDDPPPEKKLKLTAPSSVWSSLNVLGVGTEEQPSTSSGGRPSSYVEATPSMVQHLEATIAAVSQKRISPEVECKILESIEKKRVAREAKEKASSSTGAITKETAEAIEKVKTEQSNINKKVVATNFSEWFHKFRPQKAPPPAQEKRLDPRLRWPAIAQQQQQPRQQTSHSAPAIPNLGPQQPSYPYPLPTAAPPQAQYYPGNQQPVTHKPQQYPTAYPQSTYQQPVPSATAAPTHQPPVAPAPQPYLQQQYYPYSLIIPSQPPPVYYQQQQQQWGQYQQPTYWPQHQPSPWQPPPQPPAPSWSHYYHPTAAVGWPGYTNPQHPPQQPDRSATDHPPLNLSSK